jgi:hypothetical protein
MCSFGAAPSNLVVLPVHKVYDGGAPAANITDHVSMVNIMPFGMCSSMANPSVASATAAAMGALTPMPCVPNTPSPWTPGAPTVLLDNQPSLDDPSICTCVYGGVITISFAGQTTTEIP